MGMTYGFDRVWRIGLEVVGLFAAMALVTEVPSLRAGGPWYVTPFGNDGNDCLTPTTACATINAAITRASAGDTIRVATGTYTSGGSEVVLLNKSVVLSGGWDLAFVEQYGASIVDGQTVRRGIEVQPGTAPVVERFVIQGGASQSCCGGGILNNGNLTLNASTVRANTKGGIRNMNALTIDRSTISGNSNDTGGGGIDNFLFSAVTVRNSTVSGNTSTSEGAGINNAGTATITNSTFSANAAAFRGGGIANRVMATMALGGTIVAGNTGPFGPDCWRDSTAPINSSGNNLIGITTFCNYVAGTGDLTDVDARLGPLRDNGGGTSTHAPAAASPAIDAGSGACPPPATDQRGVPRRQGLACEIGAHEVAAVPAALAVDETGNGVFEPGETVVMVPTWRNGSAATIAAGAGTVRALTGPPGPLYAILDGAAAYGAIAPGGTIDCAGDCYSLIITGARPAQHWDASIIESFAPTNNATTWALHLGDSFSDVPRSNGFYRFVEALFHHGVTGGCSGTQYCPASSTTREQMAVFVLVAKEGTGYVPPACTTPVFNDVPASSPFCRWIEELARRGVVSGCGGGNYCPSSAVTREQMAVFVLRTLNPTLTPPACTTPLYLDVPATSVFCRWIEELTRRGVVTGCGGGNYCPTASVTREQMGVFIGVTFSLTLYGP